MPAEIESDRLQIAVGVILDHQRQRVLIARRLSQTRHGGLWEFPGGKQEPGESMPDALRRELLEELNLQVLAAHPLLQVSHDYADLRVLLHVWVVDQWSGEPRGMQGQELEWAPVSGLTERKFPEANLRIITALKLREFYLITPDLDHYGAEFFSRTETLIAAGIQMLQFRSQKLASAERRQTLRQLSRLCRDTCAELLINGSAEEALEFGAQGLHLSAANMLALDVRPLPGTLLVGASCHNAEELRHAQRIGADFAVLGPVNRTPTHADVAPLGWSGFRELASSAQQLPVYALGGLGPNDIPAARQAGAWGVAMISAIWSAPDPVAAIREGIRIQSGKSG